MSGKNHKMVDGRLLQTDKKYSNLKMGQKEKINIWLNEEIRRYYKETGMLPRKEAGFQLVMDRLYERIEEADIWIPYGEIHKRFFGSRNGRIDKVYGQIQKEERSLLKSQIHIEPLPYDFSVCKVEDYSQVDLSAPFTFPQRTDEENSLVCLTENVPANTTEREDGWNAFRVKGTLDFSLIGILSGIATVLAGNTIGIFAISTYNTDYILVKKTDFQKTIDVLKQKGYAVDD